MSNLSDFLNKPQPPKGLYAGQPGSNGFWRRDVLEVPGTYTWTAKKDGDILIQGLGTGSGAAGNMPGASGAFGEKRLSVTKGQTLTVVVGPGGAGINSGVSAAGAATSISGTPVGGTPLTLVGATGVQSDNIATGAPGTATGPWDLSFPGAKAEGTNKGSPSSGSPRGAGKVSAGAGGAGWGGGCVSGSAGGSSHKDSYGFPAPGRISEGGKSDTDPHGKSQPFWDLRDVDGGGGWSTSSAGGHGGVGAGGAGSSSGGPGGASALGGGNGRGAGGTQLKPGAGGGGGPQTGGASGPGGDGIVFIFWDEVAL